MKTIILKLKTMVSLKIGRRTQKLLKPFVNLILKLLALTTSIIPFVMTRRFMTCRLVLKWVSRRLKINARVIVVLNILNLLMKRGRRLATIQNWRQPKR